MNHLDEPIRTWHLSRPPLVWREGKPVLIIREPNWASWWPLSHLGSRSAAVGRLTTLPPPDTCCGGWLTAADLSVGASFLDILDPGGSRPEDLMQALGRSAGDRWEITRTYLKVAEHQRSYKRRYEADPLDITLTGEQRREAWCVAGAAVSAVVADVAGGPVDLLRYANEHEGEDHLTPSWVVLNPDVVQQAGDWVQIPPPTLPAGAEVTRTAEGVRIRSGAMVSTVVWDTWQRRHRLRCELLAGCSGHDPVAALVPGGTLIAGTDIETEWVPLVADEEHPNWPRSLGGNRERRRT